MAFGRGEIIAETGNVFSLRWSLEDRAQPGGTQTGKSSVNAALDSLKPLAGSIPGTIRMVSGYFQTATTVGHAQFMHEAGGNWTYIWKVNGDVVGTPGTNLSLSAAIDAMKTDVGNLAGTFQWANVIVRSS